MLFCSHDVFEHCIKLMEHIVSLVISWRPAWRKGHDINIDRNYISTYCTIRCVLSVSDHSLNSYKYGDNNILDGNGKPEVKQHPRRSILIFYVWSSRSFCLLVKANCDKHPPPPPIKIRNNLCSSIFIMTYIFISLLIISRDAVPMSSDDKYSWRHVALLLLRWCGMSDDWRNPEMDELEIGQVLLRTAHRLYTMYKWGHFL